MAPDKPKSLAMASPFPTGAGRYEHLGAHLFNDFGQPCLQCVCVREREREELTLQYSWYMRLSSCVWI